MDEEVKNSFPANNYGEVLAAIKNLTLIDFKEDGGYSGKYLAILKDEESDRLFYFCDHYGSCSGCDWLCDVKCKNDEVPLKEALDYCADIQPLYIVPSSMPLNFESQEYEGFKLKTNIHSVWAQALEYGASIIPDELVSEDLELRTYKTNNKIRSILLDEANKSKGV